MVTVQLIATIAAAVSALAASTALYFNMQEVALAPKRDVVRRLHGYAHMLTPELMSSLNGGEEPLVVLNEAVVVFSQDWEVRKALIRYKGSFAARDYVELLRAAAKASKAPLDDYSDDFLLTQFVPRGEGLK